ncbi:MAG: hypothetical protein DRJ30_06175 [Candidatus Methanomethylicota archaeon]|nr:MAG: hypothetical protein DRJ30_06175 [Candidatus Verstraetearchaeota archaeon]
MTRNRLKKSHLRTGIKDRVSLHTLRHTFVTMILKKTKNPLLTKFLARHASLTATSRYVHQELMDAKKKIAELK